MIEALTVCPGFDFIEAEELILRAYKTAPARVRPHDRIIGHTGYLVFARAVIPPLRGSVEESGEESLK
jgi:tRNA (adenine57-N1/adenine58-N1)-methyltransferase